ELVVLHVAELRLDVRTVRAGARRDVARHARDGVQQHVEVGQALQVDQRTGGQAGQRDEAGFVGRPLGGLRGRGLVLAEVVECRLHGIAVRLGVVQRITRGGDVAGYLLDVGPEVRTKAGEAVVAPVQRLDHARVERR